MHLKFHTVMENKQACVSVPEKFRLHACGWLPVSQIVLVQNPKCYLDIAELRNGHEIRKDSARKTYATGADDG